MDDWSLLLNRTRRMANLTQEDFASDIGVSRATLAHWENSRRPIPSKIKRYILDYMGGYYKRRIEFNDILASADKSNSFVTLYQHGLIVQGASTFARKSWRLARNDEMIGQHILPMAPDSMKIAVFYEKYFNPMLLGRSDVVSISYFDESLLYDGWFARTVATVVKIGEGRLIHLENAIIPSGISEDLLLQQEKIITMDDVHSD